MLKTMSNAAKEAGQIMLSARPETKEAKTKSAPGDYVTKYDIEIQHMLQVTFSKAFREAAFIGEESGKAPEKMRGWHFIVDPIDGTRNFVSDYHHSCVSIALAYNEDVHYGVVYNPWMDELFTAEKDKGAFCNENRIFSSTAPLKEGLILFGTPSNNRELNEKSFSKMRVFYDYAQDVRNSGSAALDLCYVASGRADVFFDYLLYPWDFAAGMLILTEAGGVIKKMTGEILRIYEKSDVLAASKRAYEDIERLKMLDK